MLQTQDSKFTDMIEITDTEEPKAKITPPKELPSEVYVSFRPTKVVFDKNNRYQLFCKEPKTFAIEPDKIKQFYDFLSTDATLESLIIACHESGYPISKGVYSVATTNGLFRVKFGTPPLCGLSHKNNKAYVEGVPTYTIVYR